MLRDLDLNQAYHKPKDNIAVEFYLPCLAQARKYDRAVGYFSSAVYVLAWPSLREFVGNGGKMRLICSPVLSKVDADAMREGYSARAEIEQQELIAGEFRRLLETPGTVKPARVLASLVALNVIDIQIAWVAPNAGARSRRLFHDKLGIFRDGSDDAVVFKGSMNETWAGLSLDGNLESVDVFLSWASERESERVGEEIEYFERLWAGSFPGVEIRPLPHVAQDEIVSAADTEAWEEFVEDICEEINTGEKWAPKNPKDQRTPRPHQILALEAWEERGRRGILEHATGSGKTFTALCAIENSLDREEVVLVVVPSELLLQQWTNELRSMFGHRDPRILVCGGGHTEWRNQRLLRQWTRTSLAGGPRIVLATVQTACSSAFTTLCSGGDHLFIVADEVHRLGARGAQEVLTLTTGPRLGLSATPERAGDPIGTRAVFDYFHGIVPPPYSLSDAIASGTLTPYAYHVHRVLLTEDEQKAWSKITNEIRHLYARLMSNGGNDEKLQNWMKKKLVRRARIVKSAEAKVETAVQVLSRHYKNGSRWIVYCDDQRQLNDVLQAVRQEVDDGVFEYHSAMTGDPTNTLGLFKRAGGVVVSIRCLDEGVDIPAVDSALILASSKNPREYVQRRGRVLRRYEGKTIANIHDAIVTPRFDPDEPPDTAIVEGELVRAIEFGLSALNPSCISDLERLAIEYSLDFDRLRGVGVEDDDIDEEVPNE